MHYQTWRCAQESIVGRIALPLSDEEKIGTECLHSSHPDVRYCFTHSHPVDVLSSSCWSTIGEMIRIPGIKSKSECIEVSE